jgi:hypothetical protein
MDASTSRYDAAGGTSPQATYWRRRFLALVGGLAVLAVVVWAASGALAPAVGSQTAVTGTSLQAHTASGRTGAGTGSSGAGRAVGGRAADGAGHSGRGSGAGSRAAGGTGTHPGPPTTHATSAPGTGAARHELPSCRADDVVLSLFASQQRYGLGQVPEFDIDVVSTAARTCKFNVGPKFLALVIRSGAVRVWSSADCVMRAGSLPTELIRGVPTVLPMWWDRATSTPGCKRAASQARDGRYVAVATDGSLTSNTQAFRLAADR